MGIRPTTSNIARRWGEAACPLKELVAALCAGGYDGDFDVELFGDEIPPSDYESLIRDSKTAFEQLMAR